MKELHAKKEEFLQDFLDYVEYHETLVRYYKRFFDGVFGEFARACKTAVLEEEVEERE